MTDTPLEVKLISQGAQQAAPVAEEIENALGYSRNFATAKPNIGRTEKEHILGLCNLLERVAKQATLAAAQDELRERCKEILEWRKNGVLSGNALREYANAQWYANEHNSLQMAEGDTSHQAFALLAAAPEQENAAADTYELIADVMQTEPGWSVLEHIEWARELLQQAEEYLHDIPESAVGGDDDANELCRRIKVCLAGKAPGYLEDLPEETAAPEQDLHDAYVGAREDLAIWKRRALEAEAALREERQITDRLCNELNSMSGPTFMGEPVLPTPEQAEHIEGARTMVAEQDAVEVPLELIGRALEVLEPDGRQYSTAFAWGHAAGKVADELRALLGGGDA